MVVTYFRALLKSDRVAPGCGGGSIPEKSDLVSTGKVTVPSVGRRRYPREFLLVGRKMPFRASRRPLEARDLV